MATVTLHPELAAHAASFSEAKANLRPLIAGLDDAQFNWRPATDRWSVAECIDHLVVIGGLTIPLLDAGIQQAADKGWKSNGPFKYGAIGNWIVRQVGPRDEKHKRKFKAPKMYAPAGHHSISRLEQAFVKLQDQFVEVVHRANGYDLGRVKLASPAARFLRLSLGQWIALLAGHQKRHLQQAQEVKDALGRRAKSA
jgi:hypothetical protein